MYTFVYMYGVHCYVDDDDRVVDDDDNNTKTAAMQQYSTAIIKIPTKTCMSMCVDMESKHRKNI